LATSQLPVLDFILSNYKNFNARQTRDALLAYWKHIQNGGRMYWAVAGAMSPRSSASRSRRRSARA
jgi:deoxyhypusine synthase